MFIELMPLLAGRTALITMDKQKTPATAAPGSASPAPVDPAELAPSQASTRTLGLFPAC